MVTAPATQTYIITTCRLIDSVASLTDLGKFLFIQLYFYNSRLTNTLNAQGAAAPLDPQIGPNCMDVITFLFNCDFPIIICHFILSI